MKTKKHTKIEFEFFKNSNSKIIFVMKKNLVLLKFRFAVGSGD